MSRLCGLAAWLCVTLGLSLLVCSTALVPDSFALADDGLQATCGSCYYTWNPSTSTWDPIGNNCQSPCSCPDSRLFPDGGATAENIIVDCTPGGIPGPGGVVVLAGCSPANCDSGY